MGRGGAVLFVSNHADIEGGGEISLLTLLKGMDRECWRPLVVVPSEGAMADRCRALGIATWVISLPSLRTPGPAAVRSLAALRRLVVHARVDLLHANGSRAMFYAGLVGRLTRRPVIWHLRVWRPDSTLDWLLARLATRTIAISEAVRSRLSPWPAAHGRCVVVPNGLDLAEFVPSKDPESVRQWLGVPSGTRTVGVVGRLVPFKGHEYLLEAFALLQREEPGIRLLIVGDGPRRRALEKQASDLGVGGAVHFTGHRQDVPDLLTIMEVFVLPSEAEDFGRVLLEAMALERPVVATAAGGVPEIIEDRICGLLVPPGDPRALADGVGTILADPERGRAMGRAGRERVEKRFSLERHAELIQTVYSEILAVPS